MAPRKLMIVGGLATYAGATYLVYAYFRPKPAAPATFSPACSTNDLWSSNAAVYDSQIDFDETLVGIKLLRRWLLRHARGVVLEVSAGTGRNIPYYKSSSDSGAGVDVVVLSDHSQEMLDMARVKVAAIPTAEKPQRFQFRTADTCSLPFPDASFDTVVQTFGLCSESDPAVALREISRVCKPDGRVLLLEHGRSGYFSWLNSILDDAAPAHAAKWGCWWNKDIESLLAAAGLRMESYHTWHFGTTYYVVARPAAASLGSISSGSTNLNGTKVTKPS